jgi:tetratricopeptide (TPR) repeat protein
MIGEAYYQAGDCETAIQALSTAISMDSRLRDAYLYRGLCYVEVGEADDAVSDLERNPTDDFEPNLALMRAYMLQEHFGDAYLQGEKVLSLAETNEEKGLAYYWRGLNFENREEPGNAADSWQELLDLPRSAVPSAMRAEALEHLTEIRTPTPSFTPSPTRTPSDTPTPSRTPTSTKTPTPSRTPTVTRTPTPSSTSTFTRTPTLTN